MFGWWAGRPVEEDRVQDENTEIEAPETPAPVFAARAFKSAIFGTPAPPDDETMLEIKKQEEKQEAKKEETMAGKDRRNLPPGNISPTKPPGILLTPGTATARRKTVSFGHGVLDKAEKIANNNGSTEIVTGRDGGKRHISAKPELDRPLKPTRLTAALENAREGRAGRGGSERSHGSSELQPLLDLNSKANDKERSDALTDERASRSRNNNQELMRELMAGEPFDDDVTTDLNEPHSRSGKYWKTEFEQYHEEAQTEMKKLTKYKNLAKSYAKKKDAEALELAEKLKEEQRRVISMEEKVSRLSARIATGGLAGQEDDSPELIKELARQTALAVQYRAQVEEFRVALEGKDGQTDALDISPRKDQTLLDAHRELKKAREQLKEMAKLRDEVRGLKKSLFIAEESSNKLRDENTKLTQELLHADFRLEKEVEKSEKRRLGSQERLQKKDEALQSLQKDYDSLKDLAKGQRRDAEYLLKKRHDQVVELKKELASMKGAESTAKDLQQALQTKTAEHERITADYQRQIQRLINTRSEDTEGLTLPSKAALTQPSQSARMAAVNNDNSHPRDSQIPVLSQSIARPVKALANTRDPRTETPAGSLRPRSPHSALSELTNSVAAERQLPKSPSSLQITPVAERFPNMSLETPDMDLPSPETSILSQPLGPGRAIQDKTYQASPRPSMFHIPSSPPKRALMRSRTSGELARQRSINALTNVASSRLSSLEGSRTRTTLPPERAAAAKARLEQKNAEKKRAQAMAVEKENIPA